MGKPSQKHQWKRLKSDSKLYKCINNIEFNSCEAISFNWCIKKKEKKKEKEEEDRKPKNIHKPDHSHSKFGISVGRPQQETEHGSIMHKLLQDFAAKL